MAVTLADHMAQIKSKVYNNSPSAVAQLDEIWQAVKNLDAYNAGSEHIQPMEDEVVHLIWNLHGCPEQEHDWPVPAPPPAADPEEAREADAAPRQGRRHKG